MFFKVRNHRGISHADISLDKVTFICGANDSGKTSTLAGIMAAVTANPKPFKGITNKQASMLVHSGTPAGYVTAEDENGLHRVDYPTMEYTSEKTPIIIGNISAGVKSLIDLSLPDRINYIVEMMDANPRKSDLKKELDKAKLDTETLLPSLWETIDINGWDNTHAHAQLTGTKLKGGWENIAQEKYGIKKAEVWIPSGYDAELTEIGIEKLTQNVADAKEWLEAAIKESSISEFEIDNLKELVTEIPKLETELGELLTRSENGKIILSEMISKRAKMNTVEVEILECPECHQKLDLENGVLVSSKAEPIPIEDTTEIDSDISKYKPIISDITEKIGGVKSRLKMLDQKQSQLLIAESNKTDSPTADVDKMRTDLEFAESRLSSLQVFNNAINIHNKILTNTKLLKILEPKGLRNAKLKKSFKTINNSLKILTDSVGWEVVEINNDCEIIYNGFPYGPFIAKSGRYRARVLLQMMVAMAEKSPLILIDDLDELTEIVRSDMFRVILKTGIPTVLVSAMDNKDKLIDTSKRIKELGGACYWIENCKAEEV